MLQTGFLLPEVSKVCLVLLSSHYLGARQTLDTLYTTSLSDLYMHCVLSEYSLESLVLCTIRTILNQNGNIPFPFSNKDKT